MPSLPSGELLSRTAILSWLLLAGCGALPASPVVTDAGAADPLTETTIGVVAPEAPAAIQHAHEPWVEGPKWFKRFEEDGYGSDRGLAVAHLPNRDFIYLGEYHRTTDLGGGLLPNHGDYAPDHDTREGWDDGDMVLARFTAEGEHVWSRGFGGPDAAVYPKSLQVEAQGTILVAGYFQSGNIDLGGGMLGPQPPKKGKEHGFIARYDADGNHLWSMALTSTGWVHVVKALSYPTGEIALVGRFNGTLDLGRTVLTAERSEFIALLDQQRKDVWAQVYVWGTPCAADLALDSKGNLIISAEIAGPVEFGGEEFASPPRGMAGTFVNKFDRDGLHLWTRKLHDKASVAWDARIPLAVDRDDNIYLTSRFYLGGDGDAAPTHLPAFVASLGSDGTQRWKRQVGPTTPVEWRPNTTEPHARLHGLAISGDALVVSSAYQGFDIDLGGDLLPLAGKVGFGFASFDVESGEHRWSRGFACRPPYGSSDPGSPTHPLAISVDRYGAIVATGWFYGCFRPREEAALWVDSDGRESPFVMRFDAPAR